VTNPDIDFTLPFLTFELSNKFSSQYFYDYIYYSKEGIDLFKSLHNCLQNNKPFNSIFIPAPKNLMSQILYSSSFRLQLKSYEDEISNPNNFRVEQILDLKSICINRREHYQEFILNKENAMFLDTLKNPLPFILEKTYRSYARAANEFDRQTYGGRLLNYILRSLVIYPLQELIYLKLDKSSKEITQILIEIESGKPIADGKWVHWFNEIAKAVGKNKEINLGYFNKLIQNFQIVYSDIQDIIPKRNDWAHYREHSAIYQKQLDFLLPKLLLNIRESLKNIEFIHVVSQKYKSENNLIIKAKRIMGYEIDIETIELNTTLPGKYFISDKLYAYKKDENYTVPLEPFFQVKFEEAEVIRMGIFDNVIDGEIKYVY